MLKCAHPALRVEMPRHTLLGPVIAISQLSRPETPRQLRDAVVGASAHLQGILQRDGCAQMEPQDVLWLRSVIKASTAQLSSELVEEVPAVAQLAHEACACLLGAWVAAEEPADAPMVAYSVMRKLVSSGQFDAGLQQGWCLHDAVRPMVERGAASASLVDMYVGSALNIVICTVEACSTPQLQAIDSVLGVVAGTLRILRYVAGSCDACYPCISIPC